MTTKKYTVTFLLTLVFASCLVFVFNYFVDPYAVSGAKRIEGFNHYKVHINSRVRLAKAYQPLRADFQTLIVGNSRVEMGVDPHHACLSAGGRKAYNLGIPGASIGYQSAAALNLVYQKPVNRVLMSLDFPDFLVAEGSSAPLNSGISPVANLQYQANGDINIAYRLSQLKDYYSAFFSLNALVSSIKTVVAQGSPATDRTEAGFNPAYDFASSTRIEGVRALFLQKEQLLQEKYQRRWSLYYENGQRSEDFEHLKAFLSVLSSRDIEVVLFINPLHERFWNLLEKNRLLDLYPDWLGEITGIVEGIQSSRVTLWNFSADSPYIHEPLPAQGEKGVALKWFWEPAHYRKELGDLMLDSIFSENCGTDMVFGEKVL